MGIGIQGGASLRPADPWAGATRRRAAPPQARSNLCRIKSTPDALVKVKWAGGSHVERAALRTVASARSLAQRTLEPRTLRAAHALRNADHSRNVIPHAARSAAGAISSTMRSPAVLDFHCNAMSTATRCHVQRDVPRNAMTGSARSLTRRDLQRRWNDPRGWRKNPLSQRYRYAPKEASLVRPVAPERRLARFAPSPLTAGRHRRRVGRSCRASQTSDLRPQTAHRTPNT